MLEFVRRLIALLNDWVAPNLRAFRQRRDALVWLIAVFVGIIVAGAAIVFRMGIGAVQYLWLGTMREDTATAASLVPWWVVILAPAAGGLVVGLLLTHAMPGRRAEAIADVIEARALQGSRIPARRGFVSALISVISLGSGASAGREGPVVHLGASISSMISHGFQLPPASSRTLLGAGAAAAVAASFNAPLAGVLFAHEVILGHYALSAFVPIVIASVGATAISRLWFGDFPAFVIPDHQITSFLEFPAFALLGLVCAVVAIALQFAIVGTDWVARNITVPLWVRPVVGGAIVGVIALAFPQVLGVGYEATDQALKQQLPLMLLIALIVAKTAATAITLASRFGGGVFSPSLYLGAMTGGAFGIIAASVFPEMASSGGLYAILGMGAVAAAVLGAPISTTLIVFELTGGLAMSIALLLSASIASALTQLVHGGSFFYWQLGLRGLFLQEGAHTRIVRITKVRDFMQVLPSDAAENFVLDEEEPWLTPDDTLEMALRAFRNGGHSSIPVVLAADISKRVGEAYYVDALSAFNEALIDANVEEHR